MIIYNKKNKNNDFVMIKNKTTSKLLQQHNKEDIFIYNLYTN